METKTRPLYIIAAEIRKDWKNIYFGAEPYLKTFSMETSVDGTYGIDSMRYVIRYFLVNAQTWRGDTARRIKTELKSMLS